MTACPRSVKSQSRPNSSIDWEGRHEMLYPTEGLLSIISCWERVNVFDLRVWSLGSVSVSVKGHTVKSM